MIVRITFDDGRVTLFGSHYKKWSEQLEEYVFKFGNEFRKAKKIEVSNADWIQHNEVKWSDEEEFQSYLNEEAVQLKLTRPRQYDELIFYKKDAIISKVAKIIKSYKRSA